MKSVFILLLLFTFTNADMGNGLNPLGPTFGMSVKAVKAKKIYRKNFKRKCRFTGAVLAKMHTQDEWEEFKENKKFKNEIYRLCPRSRGIIKEDWVEPLYYFMYNYASDAGTFPKC